MSRCVGDFTVGCGGGGQCACWITGIVCRVGGVGDQLIVVREAVTVGVSCVFTEGRPNGLVTIHGEGQWVIRSGAVTCPSGEDVTGVGRRRDRGRGTQFMSRCG